jgi:phage shock protein A
MKLDKPISDQNQGEGDRFSARRYERHVREFVAGGEVESAARDAEHYVDRAPRDAARAEAAARRGPRSTKVSLDELVAKGHTVIDRMEALARRIAGRLRRR